MIWAYLLLLGPKLLWDRVVKGKRHPGFRQRLGFGLPPLPEGRPIIWIHGVSVGEIKAMQPLFEKMKKKLPQAVFFVTTTTATGFEEAKRSLKGAAYSYMPLDFHGAVERTVRHVRPDLFLLSESDFWPKLLKQIQLRGGKTVLISGKLSKRSASRFFTFRFFAKKLFDRFDFLLVQNEEQKNRFLPLVSEPGRIHITGNPKFDLKPQIVQAPSTPHTFITIACTHAPEEEQLLDVLLTGEWRFFLAPRHPERFEEVAQLLTRKKIPFTRWSQTQELTAKVILIDAMGKLPLCYTLSRLAILGGSFVPNVGGHNILEPCLYSVPVFFGPHMFGQPDLVQSVLTARAGRQLSLLSLRAAVDQFFKESQEEMREAARQLMAHRGSSTEKVWELLVKKNLVINSALC